MNPRLNLVALQPGARRAEHAETDQPEGEIDRAVQAAAVGVELDEVLDEPDITLSIREIMANAACRSCDDKP